MDNSTENIKNIFCLHNKFELQFRWVLSRYTIQLDSSRNLKISWITFCIIYNNIDIFYLCNLKI
jgi:hypothetical protein